MPSDYDPDAYLRNHRNVRRGLNTRTRILNILRRRSANTSEIRNILNLSRSAVLRQLHLIEAEGIIAAERNGRGYRWKKTGRGQKRLTACEP